MTHLKRSIGISLWFMFLTLPLMVVRVNTINNEVEWRWSNISGSACFSPSPGSGSSRPSGAPPRKPTRFACPAVESVTFGSAWPTIRCSARFLLVAAAIGPRLPLAGVDRAELLPRNVMVSALIFVVLGLGLNITVGLAGLLDLGYVASSPSALHLRACSARTSTSASGPACRSAD